MSRKTSQKMIKMFFVFLFQIKSKKCFLKRAISSGAEKQHWRYFSIFFTIIFFIIWILIIQFLRILWNLFKTWMYPGIIERLIFAEICKNTWQTTNLADIPLKRQEHFYLYWNFCNVAMYIHISISLVICVFCECCLKCL